MASLLLFLVVSPVRFIPHFWDVVSFVEIVKASQDVELPRTVIFAPISLLLPEPLHRTYSCQMSTCVVESSRE